MLNYELLSNELKVECIYYLLVYRYLHRAIYMSFVCSLLIGGMLFGVDLF